MNKYYINLIRLTANKLKYPKEAKICVHDSKSVPSKIDNKQLVGSFTYLMLSTRLDFGYLVKYFSRLQSNATESEWKGFRYILRYPIIKVKLFFSKNNNITSWICWFRSEYCYIQKICIRIELYDFLVCLYTRKQSTVVVLSSMEAEYI